MGGVRRAVWGADRRKVRQPIPYPQTGRCPLSLRGRLLTRGEPGGCWNEETWELLRGRAGHLMSSTRVECVAEWAEGERQPLQYVTKARPDSKSRRKSRRDAAIITPRLLCEEKIVLASRLTSKHSSPHHDWFYVSFIHLFNNTGNKRGVTATQIWNLSFTETCQTSQPQWSRGIFFTWHKVESCRQRQPFEGYREPEMRGSPACRGISRVEVPVPPRCN